MLNNKKGQMLAPLIQLSLGITIFIFAAPVVSDILDDSIAGFGTATVFVVKLFLWVILLVLIALFFKIVNSGEGFFA